MKKLFIIILILIAADATQYKTVKHSIKKGETLYIIAHANHTTIEEVRKVNGLKKGDILKIGRVLTVPTNTYFPKNKQVTLFTDTTKNYKEKIVTSKILKKPETKFVKKSKNIIKLAKQKLGKRYVWGAVGKRNTFDCSGFTNYVFKKNGINIPRTSLNQSKYGKYIKRNNLKKGDLIFFDTSKKHKGYVNHVGIYLGNNKFIHASSAKKRVIVSNLSKFYGKRYKGARRPS